MLQRLKRVALLGPGLLWLYHRLGLKRFPGSAPYWEARYRQGMNSGSGSYGRLAVFKAQVLNDFVQAHGIRRVVEFGCGDGHQLSLAKYPEYLGLDVSPTAVQLCTQRFRSDATKSFMHYDGNAFHDPLGIVRADLALSLDVVYHLVEDEVYLRYLDHLFSSAARFVILYTSDADAPAAPHVRHRAVTRTVAERYPHWHKVQHVPNPYPYDPKHPAETSFADFHVFAKKA